MIEPLPVEALLTPEEYLAAENSAEVKHEYVGGRVYAFSGASTDHNRLATNLVVLLGNHLAGGPCEVFGSDMLFRAAEDILYYPDLMVCCDVRDDEVVYMRRPRLVIEISSPSTKRIDEGEKALSYWRVASIEVYVIVEQETLRVRVLRRGADFWDAEILTQPSDRLTIPSLGFETTLAAIYARTRLGGTG